MTLFYHYEDITRSMLDQIIKTSVSLLNHVHLKIAALSRNVLVWLVAFSESTHLSFFFFLIMCMCCDDNRNRKMSKKCTVKVKMVLTRDKDRSRHF